MPALASESTFERTLAVNGRVDLTITTGAGNIHITRGTDNQVHILGRVKTDWDGSEERARQVADHPPIEQIGNIIRIGVHQGNLHNIHIDYEIQAPQNSFLTVASGSGDITVDSVGDDAKISTGSGNVHAVGLHEGFKVNSGSGDIYAEQTGMGDVNVRTGSGNIELRNLHGGLEAAAGSGNIKASGTPAMQWRLHTGSGDVELWTGSAPLTLDASTGSGNVHCDRSLASQSGDRSHHLAGDLNGGGPLVHISTGSGDIRVH